MKEDVKLSRIGFGTWALSKKGWKGVNEAEALKSLEYAYNSGINFIDTAPVYGFGRAESAIGEVLSSVRDNVFVATKCGLVWDRSGKVSHNLTRDSIMREVDESLSRMKTDYIDLYQLHWPDPSTPLEESLSALAELKERGVIRHIGLSNFSVEDIQKASEIAGIFSIQDKYNWLEREAEEKFPVCRERGIKFIAYSPLAQGLLTGKMDESFVPAKDDIRRFNPLFSDREMFLEACKKVKNYKIFVKHALKFLINNQDVYSILISMTKVRHVQENLKFLTEMED